MLGLKAAFWHDGEQLWAAAAIAVASGAGATMAVWRRREGWAFAAALGVNVAASLVVWHLELLRQLSFNDYWLRLVQANVIASAAVAVVWLAARKRLYELREMTLRRKSPAGHPGSVAGARQLRPGGPAGGLAHAHARLAAAVDERIGRSAGLDRAAVDCRGRRLVSAAIATGQPAARAGGPCTRRGGVGRLLAWTRSIGLRRPTPGLPITP